MANNKTLNNIETQSDLPEPAIQRIQSNLTRKEAASTVVLSKAWYNAWSTRPSLDFDERDFRSYSDFFNHVSTTLERYHTLNLKLHTFTLWMKISDDVHSRSHATELIVKALKLGATDFNLEFSPPFSDYILPKELLESDSLVRLSAAGCSVCCLDVPILQLKSLSLHKVDIEGGVLVNFPCGLEDVVVSDCVGFEQVDVGRMVNSLKKFSFIRVANVPIRMEIPKINFGQPNVYTYCRLACLLLERVEIDSKLFCNFSDMFPCVTDLTVRHCDGCLNFDISSPKINYISLAHTRKLKIRLDVPNIVKFKFSGATNVPILRVESASRKWESDITLTCWRNLHFVWFLELNEFLSSLSRSKISLGVELVRVTDIERLPNNIRPNFKPVVAKLTLGGKSWVDGCGVALLEGSFWSCQPELINFCVYATNGGRSFDELLLLLSHKVMSRDSWRHGLRPVGCTGHFDEKEMQLRFHLRWPKD